MSGWNTEIEKQQARRDSAAGRLEEFRAALVALDTAKPNEGDIEAMLAFEERRGAAEARVRIASRALEVAEAGLAAAKADTAAKMKDRTHAEAQKTAEAAAKLTHEIVADAEALAKKLARLEAMRKAVDEANRTRGGRPFIADGERRVREVPGRSIPAVYRMEEVWVDAAGNQPSQVRTRSDGERVDSAGSSVRQVTRRVEQSPERFEPAYMPDRLSEVIVLPTLSGRGTLWPPC